MTGPRRTSLSLAAALVLHALLWLTLSGPVVAQTPDPTSAGGDPRSSGEGPGLVGDPGFAILGVALVAAIAVGGTLAYVRLTGGARREGPTGSGGSRNRANR